MKNIIIGNGVNLQFGGRDYNIHSIMQRLFSKFIYDNCYDNLINGIINKQDLIDLLNQIVNEFNCLLKSNSLSIIDSYIDKSALLDVKHRYKYPVKDLSEIMLEDIFLPLHILLSKKQNIYTHKIREVLEMMVFDSIFNNGKLQKLYLLMPNTFKHFLLSFNNIFTLNYDNNIENLTSQQVYHLHGDFSVLADKLNTNTIIGYVNNISGKLNPVDTEHIHMFCNALLDYCGNNKIKQAILDWETNVLYDRIAKRYKEELEFKLEIENLKDNSPDMYNNVMAKINNPSLKFRNDYYFHKMLNDIEGEIHILGMSPNNDNHIFNLILNNERIHTVIFYYFSENDIDIIKNVFHNRHCGFAYVLDLWKLLGC